MPISDQQATGLDMDMADLTLTTCALLTLPLEILIAIFGSMERLELKNSRLTSKLLCTLCAPHLFCRYVIFPHQKSLEQLAKLAETPFRHCVRSLELDARFSSLPHHVLHSTDSFSYGGEAIRPADKEKLLEKAEILYKERLESTAGWNMPVQMFRLERSIRCLNNLKEFVVHEQPGYRDWYQKDMPLFYTKNLFDSHESGHSALVWQEKHWWEVNEPQTNFANSVLVTVRDLPQPLERLEVTGIAWSLFLREKKYKRIQVALSQILGQIKVLILSTQGQRYPVKDDYRAVLQSILKASTNLGELSIRFRHNITMGSRKADFRDDQGNLIVSDFRSIQDKGNRTVSPGVGPFRLLWSSRIRSLCLSGLRCTPQEIQTELKHCASTLEYLRLEDILLLPDYYPTRMRGPPRSCFVALFRWIRQHTHLKSVILRGQFTNEGRQYWRIDDRCSLFQKHQTSNLLLPRVRRWLLNRNDNNPCPIEHLAVRRGEHSLAQETDQLADVEYAGDESWSISYNKYYSEDVDVDWPDDD